MKTCLNVKYGFFHKEHKDRKGLVFFVAYKT